MDVEEYAMLTEESSGLSEPSQPQQERWHFWRDVLVFALKMLLGSFRDFALIPVSLGAALCDLIFRGERDGSLFYRVLRWGWRSEEVLDVYSPIKNAAAAEPKVNPNYTVDAVVARMEGVVRREFEKGGTAASIKDAVDRAVDQMHRETSARAAQTRQAFAKTADKLRQKFSGKGSPPRE